MRITRAYCQRQNSTNFKLSGCQADEHTVRKMKIRKNLTLGQATLDKAESLVVALDLDDISSLVAHLIREEHERRQRPATVPSTATTKTEPPPPEPAAKLKSARRRARRAGRLVQRAPGPAAHPAV